MISGAEIVENAFYGMLVYAQNAVVTNNRFIENGNRSTLSNFVNTSGQIGGLYDTFSDNIIDGSGGDGIDLGGSQYARVHGNVIKHVNAYCIEVSSTQDANVTGNYCEDAFNTTAVAGALHAVIIEDRDAGTILPSRRVASVHNIISQNTVKPNGKAIYGIWVDDTGSNVNSSAGVVFANIAQDFGTGNGVVSNSPTVIASGNITDDALRGGLRLDRDGPPRRYLGNSRHQS